MSHTSVPGASESSGKEKGDEGGEELTAGWVLDIQDRSKRSPRVEVEVEVVDGEHLGTQQGVRDDING